MKGKFEGEILRGEMGWSVVKYRDFRGELCKNGSTDRDAVWDMDSSGPKEACVRWVCTLVPPGEYDRTVYFDHLL